MKGNWESNLFKNNKIPKTKESDFHTDTEQRVAKNNNIIPFNSLK